jgi:small subunit ribosomal protein S3
MGQKVHPLGFRLGVTQKHQSQWFADSKKYSQCLLEDNLLRETLFNRFVDARISKVQIQRRVDLVRIEIEAARPGIIVGRRKEGLEKLKQDLTSLLKKHRNKKVSVYQAISQQANDKQVLPQPLVSQLENKQLVEAEVEHNNHDLNNDPVQVSIHVTELANPNGEPSFIADTIVEQLEKRVPFRRVMRQAIRRSQRARVKGIKIQIAGRLNGAEIARTEWVREGRVPLQTLRADVDYSTRIATTIYGVLGIKVWVFKGVVSKTLRFK